MPQLRAAATVLRTVAIVLGACSVKAADERAATPSAVTIDFESLAQSGSGVANVGLIYSEQGFVFSDVSARNGLARLRTEDPSYAGSTMLFNNGSSAETSLFREDNGQFDFLGIDLAKLQFGGALSVTFLGYRGSDLVASEAFEFDSSSGVHRFVPPMGFTAVTEVRWAQESPYHQFDNVQVRAVGGAGPGPQVRIGAEGSLWRLEFSYLVRGTSYTVRVSDDLGGWQDYRQFMPYAPTARDFDVRDPAVSRRFYRLEFAQ